MKWIPDKSPPDSGPHLISLKRQRKHSQQLFIYVAYYDAGTKKWYKYDPFEDHYKPTKEIDGLATAWGKDVGVFYA